MATAGPRAGWHSWPCPAPGCFCTGRSVWDGAVWEQSPQSPHLLRDDTQAEVRLPGRRTALRHDLPQHPSRRQDSELLGAEGRLLRVHTEGTLPPPGGSHTPTATPPGCLLA